MKFNVEKILENIVRFLIIVKIIFISTTIGDFILKHFFKNNTSVNNSSANKIDKKFLYWKKLTEFIFVIATSLLMIFIFSPWHKNQTYITREMTIMFYLFGYIMIFTADWDIITK